VSARDRSRGSVFSVGLDSFVDIVMNVMGALFFMVIYVALLSHGMKSKITTPLTSASLTKPVFFECRNNTVFKTGLDQLAERLVSELKQCMGKDSSLGINCIDKLREAGKVRNAFYIARPGLAVTSGGLGLAVSYEEAPGSRGESANELQQPGSAFRREMEGLDARKDHIFFIVRADSFAIFHSARRVARQQGFQTGWEPFKRDAKLGSGGGGRASFDPRDIQ